jgi:hypothetical protein
MFHWSEPLLIFEQPPCPLKSRTNTCAHCRSKNDFAVHDFAIPKNAGAVEKKQTKKLARKINFDKTSAVLILRMHSIRPQSRSGRQSQGFLPHLGLLLKFKTRTRAKIFLHLKNLTHPCSKNPESLTFPSDKQSTKHSHFSTQKNPNQPNLSITN